MGRAGPRWYWGSKTGGGTSSTRCGCRQAGAHHPLSQARSTRQRLQRCSAPVHRPGRWQRQGQSRSALRRAGRLRGWPRQRQRWQCLQRSGCMSLPRAAPRSQARSTLGRRWGCQCRWRMGYMLHCLAAQRYWQGTARKMCHRLRGQIQRCSCCMQTWRYWAPPLQGTAGRTAPPTHSQWQVGRHYTRWH